jgi:F-type H+-transporting ATPase subunit a
MEHQLLFTRFLNHHFGAFVTQVMLALHVHPENPGAPITNAYSMELLCVGFLLLLFIIVRMSLRVENPGTVQHLAEMYDGFINEQGEQIIGHGYERFMAYIGALALFVLTCNLIGLIPGFDSPTAYVIVPLGIALPTFVYYHWYGFREQGFWGYIKHFFGPVAWMAPFMFLIEIISHLARILSLTVRLYANMFAGDMVYLVIFSLLPVGIPIIFIALHLGVSLIQAYVFMLLALIYLGGATSHDATANV